MFLKEKKRTNQVEKPRDLLVLIITTRLSIKTCLVLIFQIIPTQKSLLLLRNKKTRYPISIYPTSQLIITYPRI
jgi:hypothetical protein